MYIVLGFVPNFLPDIRMMVFVLKGLIFSRKIHIQYNAGVITSGTEEI